MYPKTRRSVFVLALALATLVVAVIAATTDGRTADAATPAPDQAETARLLGYLWADGSKSNGVWDATGPSGAKYLIESLVQAHGGTWVDRSQLTFRLPEPFDWDDWKHGLPDDDAWTRAAVQNSHFLAAMLEGEGGTDGLIYDQDTCCTNGFTRGRMIELRQLLIDRGLGSARIIQTSNADSGRVVISSSDFASLRSSTRYVCPVEGSAIRIPGGQNYAAYGPLRWFGDDTRFAGTVRGDCQSSVPIDRIGPPTGTCSASSLGNGDVVITWTVRRGEVTIRRSGAWLSTMSAIGAQLTDRPPAGQYDYTIRVQATGGPADFFCGRVGPGDDPPTPPPPPTNPVTCRGLVATIVGTDGDDRLTGTPGRDIVYAGAGVDRIETFGGDDVICAGPGADIVDAGEGQDFVLGGAGADQIEGGPGTDLLRGGIGADTIRGGGAQDRINGQDGNDMLYGDRGKDRLYGGNGADRLIGGVHKDRCLGQAGPDTATECEVLG